MPETEILFVETRASEQRNLLCRWVERFYEDGKRAQVAADSTMAAQVLDQLLWTFSQPSFIPHRIFTTRDVLPAVEPVVITVGETPLEDFDVLVCDGPVHLELMAHYPMVVHFVLVDDPEKKQESRMLWQTARDRGFRLRHVPAAAGAGQRIH